MNESIPNEPVSSVPPIWNVPNLLTFLRILLAVAIFVVMPLGHVKMALVFFIIAALTDYLDGWWARRFQQVSKLGRIADPFADKLLICGAFIYLTAYPELTEVRWGIAPWMVVLIVSRELLVTLLRSVIEAGGGDFSAKWAGKFKMAFQCFAVIASLLYLILYREGEAPDWLRWTMIALLWITVVLTIHSCVQYIVAAVKASCPKRGKVGASSNVGDLSNVNGSDETGKSA